MGFLDRLLGKGKTKGAPGTQPEVSPARRLPGSADERALQLWESVKKLGVSEADRRKAVAMCTEILGLLDPNTTSLHVGVVFWQRGVSYRLLKNYDAALADLQQALEFGQRRGDYSLVLDSQRVMEEIRQEKRRAEIEAGGGEKADRLQAMEQQARQLWRTGPEADAAFESLFADLQDGDSDVRIAASRLLGEPPNAVRRLISIYQQDLASDPHRAHLAGRVLGRAIAKGSTELFPAEIARMKYGLDFSVIPCSCVHCGAMNLGIAVPPRAPMVPYYHQEDDKGAYAIPVLCDKCSTEFFVVWDVDPR
ncbi:MAG: tetratricopeptide repeat protein [Chloroflexi bacterium]|nr:tetratricopeptide repeat protein [Chloroflexota bacterium]